MTREPAGATLPPLSGGSASERARRLERRLAPGLIALHTSMCVRRPQIGGFTKVGFVPRSRLEDGRLHTFEWQRAADTFALSRKQFPSCGEAARTATPPAMRTSTCTSQGHLIEIVVRGRAARLPRLRCLPNMSVML